MYHIYVEQIIGGILFETIRKNFRLYDFQKGKETATVRNAMHSGQLQISNAPT